LCNSTRLPHLLYVKYACDLMRRDCGLTCILIGHIDAVCIHDVSETRLRQVEKSRASDACSLLFYLTIEEFSYLHFLHTSASQPALKIVKMFYSHDSKDALIDTTLAKPSFSPDISSIWRCHNMVSMDIGLTLILKCSLLSTRLVATLGSKSTLKKVNRKDILDVNVSKACQTVMEPSAPLALRLQSNLLYARLVSVTHPSSVADIMQAMVYHASTHSNVAMFLRTPKPPRLP